MTVTHFSGTLFTRNIYWFFMDLWSEFEALNSRCCLSNVYIFLFRYGSTVPVDLDLLIVVVSKSYSVRQTTVCMTPGDVWSVNRRHICLIILIIHNRQTSMALAGFKPTIKGTAESLRLRSRGHWKWPYVLIRHNMLLFYVNVKFFELAVKQVSIKS